MYKLDQCQSHQFYNSSKIKKLDMSLNIETEVGDVQTDVKLADLFFVQVIGGLVRFVSCQTVHLLRQYLAGFIMAIKASSILEKESTRHLA